MNKRFGDLMMILCASAALGGVGDPNGPDSAEEPAEQPTKQPTARPTSQAETRDTPIYHYNGVELNGAVINGWSLNGWSLNGWSLNGWSLNGWSLNGWSLNGVSLDGTLFKGTQKLDGQTVYRSGLDFIGSNLYMVHDDQQYTLRIDDIQSDPEHNDVYFYRISVENPKDGTWSSLCLDSKGQPTEAIPLANHWDAVTGDRIDEEGTVTFACRGLVLAKCVEWGYRPWASATACKKGDKHCKSVTLADHHQACTRMARADYCGEGNPHTINDTPIDIIDHLSPQLQSESTAGIEGWAVEAEWGPDGALCVGESLRLHMLEELGKEVLPADCLAKLERPNCGNFSPIRDALLVNKYCESWMADPDYCAKKTGGGNKGKPKKFKPFP
jgi:hypothetical protein